MQAVGADQQRGGVPGADGGGHVRLARAQINLFDLLQQLDLRASAAGRAFQRRDQVGAVAQVETGV